MAPLKSNLLTYCLFISGTFTALANSSPTPSTGEQKQFRRNLSKRADLQVVKTTVTEHNVIDWIPIESQGKIAQAPPLPAGLKANTASYPVPELRAAGAEVGPPGTVPVPRIDPAYIQNATRNKQLPPNFSAGLRKEKRQNSGQHWYVNSNMDVANIGGSASYSAFDAFVESSGDFNLLQVALAAGNPLQTLEAGWMNYPDQIQEPHLFTFFNTNGYAQSGDNIGGYNQDQAGWVQVDTTIFPGTVLTPNSEKGGSQVDIPIEYQYMDGNWWLRVIDTWIGYYPGSLFTDLASQASSIAYYGEIYNSEDALTTTDMGSGNFANAGYGQAGYIHSMTYRDTSGNLNDYVADFSDSDSSRYSHDTSVAAGGDWGKYAYIGGPGAGGVVDG